MRIAFVDDLRCPGCGASLPLEEQDRVGDRPAQASLCWPVAAVRSQSGIGSHSVHLRRLSLVGPTVARVIPVANYCGKLPLSDQQLEDLAVPYTFDWLSPRYDKPQRTATIERWLYDAGLSAVSVRRITGGELGGGGVMVGRGTRP